MGPASPKAADCLWIGTSPEGAAEAPPPDPVCLPATSAPPPARLAAVPPSLRVSTSGLPAEGSLLAG